MSFDWAKDLIFFIVRFSSWYFWIDSKVYLSLPRVFSSIWKRPMFKDGLLYLLLVRIVLMCLYSGRRARIDLNFLG